MTRHRNHLICAAIGLAIAACPSAALAGQDLRSPDRILAEAGIQTQDLRSPDRVLAERRAQRREQRREARSPDRILAEGGGAGTPAVGAPVVKVSDGGGLDFGSAGIGAAAMLGLVLALVGGALVVRPRMARQSSTG